MSISILYGTESGNAEMAADDIAAALGGDVEVVDLSTLDPADLDPAVLYLVLCSTYGEGELPIGAQPFAAALEETRPDLSGIRYALLGLGDSSYEDTYSRGGDLLDAALAARGAMRLGDIGRHDASGRRDLTEVAVEWAQGVVEALGERALAA